MAELHRYNGRNTALEPEFAILDRIRILPIFDLSARYPNKVDQISPRLQTAPILLSPVFQTRGATCFLPF